MWYYTPFSSLKFARILLLYISGCREGGKQTCHTNFIVQFQKISILPPQKGLKFPGGFCNARKFKELYEAYIIGIFRGVEGGGSWKKSLPWGRYVHVGIFTGITRGTFLFVNVSFLFLSLLKFSFLVPRCFTSRFLRTGKCI